MSKPFEPFDCDESNPLPGTIEDWIRQHPPHCEIERYLPGIHCDKLATTMWGHGGLIRVCEFHARLPRMGTETELLTALYQLENGRGQNQDGRL